jgi:prepilin-type N-terminal cleavage/methylation domain-containing protein
MQKSRESFYKQGFSLIELIIALGILLIITGAIVSAFTNGLKTIRRDRSFAERDADVKRAIELMTIELGQAGITPEILPIGAKITAISSKQIGLTAGGDPVKAVQGLYPERPIILGLPENGPASEFLKISDVNSGCAVPCVTTAVSPVLPHAGDFISSPMLPIAFGILNKLPGGGSTSKIVNHIGFVGDIFSNGDLYYVEYKFDSGARRLLRSSNRLRDGSGQSDVVLIDNVEAASFDISYASTDIPIPTSVRIILKARSSVMEPNGEFKKVSINTEVVPRGTAAAALIWASGAEDQLRNMIPPCSSTNFPPCDNWSEFPWWSVAWRSASALP